MIFRTINGKVIPMPNLNESIRGRVRQAGGFPRTLRRAFPTTSSFITPNARCPVCGQAVWFYRSPYNGRVYFDEIGPDWPKHPCTDNQDCGRGKKPLSGAQRRKNTLRSRKRLSDLKNIRWYARGWRPAFQLAPHSIDQVTLKVRFSVRPKKGKRFDGFLDKRDLGRAWGAQEVAIEQIRAGLVFYRLEEGRVRLAILGESLRPKYFPLYRSHIDVKRAN
jgi:hypothetical protein